MLLENLIEQLQISERIVGGDVEVFVHYCGEEIELYNISLRINDDDYYEVIVE